MAATAAARAKKLGLSREDALRIINSLPFLVATSNHALLPRSVTAIESQRARRFPGRVYAEPANLKRTHLNAKHALDAAHPIVLVAYEVWSGRQSYVFPEQPFRVMREITREEYLRVFPRGAAGNYYYEINTD